VSAGAKYPKNYRRIVQIAGTKPAEE